MLSRRLRRPATTAAMPDPWNQSNRLQEELTNGVRRLNRPVRLPTSEGAVPRCCGSRMGSGSRKRKAPEARPTLLAQAFRPGLSGPLTIGFEPRRGGRAGQAHSSAVPPGLVFLQWGRCPTPGVNSWAILGRPSGTLRAFGSPGFPRQILRQPHYYSRSVATIPAR